MPQPARHPARSGKAPTIYTVAAHAGVSHQTVSRFLKGESLRPANRERVEQAMKVLDFRVNDTARALATNRAQRIGAFIFEVDDWAPQRVLSGAAEAARRAGYVLDIVRIDANDDTAIDQAVDLMNRTSLAGVVVLSPSDPMLDRLHLERLRVPWFVEAEPELVEGQDVTAKHPFTHVVDHLADLGHERFFYLGGPLTWLPARNRRATYRDAIRRRRLVNCGETTSEWGAPGGPGRWSPSPSATSRRRSSPRATSSPSARCAGCISGASGCRRMSASPGTTESRTPLTSGPRSPPWRSTSPTSDAAPWKRSWRTRPAAAGQLTTPGRRAPSWCGPRPPHRPPPGDHEASIRRTSSQP